MHDKMSEKSECFLRFFHLPCSTCSTEYKIQPLAAFQRFWQMLSICCLLNPFSCCVHEKMVFYLLKYDCFVLLKGKNARQMEKNKYFQFNCILHFLFLYILLTVLYLLRSLFIKFLFVFFFNFCIFFWNIYKWTQHMWCTAQ